MDQAVGATCGMTLLTDDDMEMLADKMTMNRDLHCTENKSEVQSGAAMQAIDKPVRQSGYEDHGS